VAPRPSSIPDAAAVHFGSYESMSGLASNEVAAFVTFALLVVVLLVLLLR
jgi:hypothetical protein